MRGGSVGYNFWNQIKKTAECWWWLGCRDSDGYGTMRLNNRRYLVHRFIWTWFNDGLIPDGLYVLHKCDNPSCVNPAHLFLGTQQDNVKDRDQKGRRQPPQGENNGKAKLSEWDVREIRRRIDMPMVALAKAFMVSVQNIYLIQSCKTWKHIM